MKISSKQRAYLKGLAMELSPVLQLGKGGLTPEFTASVDQVLEARELVKLGVLQNCAEDPKEVAQTLAERTRASVVQVIGRKIVLYRPKRESRPKIELPK